MEKIIFLLLVFIIVIIFIFSIKSIYNKNNVLNDEKLKIAIYDNRIKSSCPAGCDNGICKNPSNCDNCSSGKCCCFNYQCKNCKVKEEEEEVDVIFYDDRYINNEIFDIRRINEIVLDKNRFIKEINKQVENINMMIKGE
jgi:hypothetical protein